MKLSDFKKNQELVSTTLNAKLGSRQRDIKSVVQDAPMAQWKEELQRELKNLRADGCTLTYFVEDESADEEVLKETLEMHAKLLGFKGNVVMPDKKSKNDKAYLMAFYEPREGLVTDRALEGLDPEMDLNDLL